MATLTHFLRSLGDNPKLEPLLRELITEESRKQFLSDVVPEFWLHLHEGMSAEEALEALLVALEQLCQTVGATAAAYSLPHTDMSPEPCLLRVLHSALSITVPPFLYRLMEAIFSHSLEVWEDMQGLEEGHSALIAADSMETEVDENGGGGRGYWHRFTKMVSHLRELQVLNLLADQAIAEVAHSKVKVFVKGRCAGEFDQHLLEDAIVSLQQVVLGWLQHACGSGDEVEQQWKPQVEYLGHRAFAELRIGELFEILVEYPDSQPALLDLKACLEVVNLRAFLISSLKSAIETRLLHPGANTPDILTQYISAIKGLRLLDPSGVVLEHVCEPVRVYLCTREDTQRCIVASLTDEYSNELADELVTGKPVLVDLNEESDSEDQDFDSWQPDPVDADPTKTSKSRHTSDIISILVNIYGSREVFVNEYRNLLADRLLQSLNYDISREVRNVELLKLRFGEGNLHFCEVMIKDVADSRRINGLITMEMRKEREALREEATQGEGGVELNAFILSHVFWPTFREEKLKLPDFIQKRLDEYRVCFQKQKAMRTIEWKPHLGLVQVELELADRELSLAVSPIRAVIIHSFQEQSSWTVDGLSMVLEAQPSVVRRHLGFWVSQGVLRERPTNTFSVVEKHHEETRAGQGEEEEEESAMASAEEQKESELQMFWAYIVGMLTAHSEMPLDRIHTMLAMFTMDGQGCSQAQLKSFLDRKVREQQLVFSRGKYQLPS